MVGFDPRGVGRSSAVTCYDAAQMDDYLYGIVRAERGSDEWIDRVEVGSGRLRAGVPARTPETSWRRSTP